MLVVLFLCPLAAQTVDFRGSKDHPLLSRYPGSVIRAYAHASFDEYPLALGVENRRPSNVQTIEGQVTKITYLNPKGRSSLEIYRNYEQALAKAGFKTLWNCAAPDCGAGMYWRALNGLQANGPPGGERYLTMRGEVNSQQVTVAMAVSDVTSVLHIIESKAMEGGLVTASAAELGEGIDRDGHIAVYSLYFDSGKATLTAESEPGLREIAELLKARPNLNLLVVGHTDSTGSMSLNMTLSGERAASVVNALTGKHAIASNRLQAHGVGPLAPVATNRSDAGKGKNRRVELVEQ